MDNLITETNARLQEIIDNLETIKIEYEKKLESNSKTINQQLNKVKKYKEDFFISKEKIEKMNADIDGFEEDYKNLVERFKDDELANILIAANKEISAKIDERKRKIVKDKASMNELVEKAEEVKKKLVKLTAEKKALELCLAKINDSYEFYSKSLKQIINYSLDNRDHLCSSLSVDGNLFDPITIKNDEINFEDITTNNDDIIDEEIIEETSDDEESNDKALINSELLNEDIQINEEENLEEEYELATINLDEIPDIDINIEDVNEDLEENEEVILESSDEAIDSQENNDEYDYNSSFDLENIINFDDSLEDDEELYKKNEEEDN